MPFDNFGTPATIGFPAITATQMGGLLNQILVANDIVPGDDVSYSLCKAIFIGHPLGGKMTESPVRMAQSQEREITVANSPESDVVEEFKKSWEELELDRMIMNLVTQARIYGIASLGVLDLDDPSKPFNIKDCWKKELFFNIFDPLNTAGSMVTNQNPNSPLFQKWGPITVNGTTYHPSRTATFMNEESLYIAWTTSAFGYVGRSVYQRGLYPLKSFLQTMITDDMVTRKAGLIVARMEQAGTIVDRVMQAMFGVKRNLLKEAQTNNVISVGRDEIIEAINLRNVNDSMRESRENIIKNIATAADMPAKLLTQESFVEGFGEGTQDAYAVAQYIDRLRVEMRPIYRWADRVCMYRAWNPEFYQGIQQKYQDYRDVTYEAAFQRWCRSFKALWPSLIKEEPSEAINIQKIKMEAVLAYVGALGPQFDAQNRVKLIQWACDQANSNEKLFGGAVLQFDPYDLEDHINSQEANMGGGEGEMPPMPEEESMSLAHKAGPAFSAQDAAKVVNILEQRLHNDQPIKGYLRVGA